MARLWLTSCLVLSSYILQSTLWSTCGAGQVVGLDSVQHTQQARRRQQEEVLDMENYRKGKHLIKAPAIQDTFMDSDAVYRACPAAGQPIIIGMTSYKASALCPFVHSIQLHMPDAQLVLFTDNPELQGELLPSCLDQSKVHVLLAKTQPTDKVTWHFWRYFLYRNFLSMCREYLNGPLPPVMFADSRDSLAQGDVFEHPQMKRAVRERGVIFALEGNVGPYGEPIQVRQDSHYGNKFMFRGATKCWKPLLSQKEWGDFMSGDYYSCSGVTMGNGDAMLHYSHAMVDFMLNRAPAQCLQHIGGDQHVHAMLLFAKLNSSNELGPHWNVTRFRFKAMPMNNGLGSPVYSSALGMPLSMDASGMIWVVREGYTLRPLFVHQHDRNKQIAARLTEMYPCNMTSIRVMHHRVRIVKTTWQPSGVMRTVKGLTIAMVPLGAFLFVCVWYRRSEWAMFGKGDKFSKQYV